ncbi:MAG: peptidoglycan-binding protein, partial [Alicyclobacillus sp.]|nr:peptidoglycan-binding protein [Alicyclobacillus sp.]
MTLPSHQTIGQAFTARDLMVGSEGYDVYELQNRLKFLGYYHHKVDGIFGWSTYWAVRDFQYAFGMKVTGYVDMKTKIKLVKATRNWHYRPWSNRTNPGRAVGQSPAAPGATSASNAAPPAHLR